VTHCRWYEPSERPQRIDLVVATARLELTASAYRRVTGKSGTKVPAALDATLASGLELTSEQNALPQDAGRPSMIGLLSHGNPRHDHA
jgi:hypothetical protein